MRVLIAPDKFKHALSAEAAALAMCAGVRQVCPRAEIDLCPLADGGEGSGPILARAMHAAARSTRVADPLGRSAVGEWWWAAPQRTAIVEAAQACGLWRVASSDRDPLRCTTHGVGELLCEAAAAGAQTILLTVGGTATVDGGAGCLQALGYRLRTQGQADCERVTPERLELIREVATPAAPALRGASVRILCDVDNPLLGSLGAARVFGPQKGAAPEDVEQLEDALRVWCGLLERTFGTALAEQPFLGAAGGLPAALVAAGIGRAESGFASIAAQVGLSERLAAADVCVTGEGRLDRQTLRGKVVGGVAALGRACGTPVAALVGSLGPGERADTLAHTIGLHAVRLVSPPEVALEAALSQTEYHLQRAAAAFMTEWLSDRAATLPAN